MIKLKDLNRPSLKLLETINVNGLININIKTKWYYNNNDIFILEITNVNTNTTVELFNNNNQLLERFILQPGNTNSYLKIDIITPINRINVNGRCVVNIYRLLKQIQNLV